MRFAALVLALASCHPLESRFRLSIDSTFTAQEECLTREAARRWEVATSGAVDITFWHGVSTTPGEWDISNHTAFRGFDSDARKGGRDPEALGFTELIPGGPMWVYVDRIWSVYPDRYAEAFLYVQIHELGHHMGVGHDRAHTIMAGSDLPWSWDDRGEPCITQADVDAFCKLYGCSLVAPPCDLAPKAAEVCGL
jgi:hypothetical protein